MMRLLFWLALAILVVAAIRSKLRSMARDQQQRQGTPPAAPGKPEGQAEAMACCAHCGLHFPASEAVRADGLDYCSPAHVRLPPK
jgi:uncharacterized protein